MIRSDLPLGVAAAQLVHAAGESSPGNLPGDTFAVVLQVPSEASLRALAARLAPRVAHRLIVEADGPYAGQACALGAVPGPRSTLRQYFSNLPLYGRVAQRQSTGVLHPETGGLTPSAPSKQLNGQVG